MLPAGLTIVMGVDVDEAWCRNKACCVEFLDAGFSDVSDGRDASIFDGDVGRKAVLSRTVDNMGLTNDDIHYIGHGVLLFILVVRVASASVAEHKRRLRSCGIELDVEFRKPP